MKEMYPLLRIRFVPRLFFPDEGSLVCALLFLNQCSDNSPDIKDFKEKSNIEVMPFNVVRIKNLFRVTPLGSIVSSDLSTGYRHVLVNIRLNNDGLIAGKNYNFNER